MLPDLAIQIYVVLDENLLIVAGSQSVGKEDINVA